MNVIAKAAVCCILSLFVYLFIIQPITVPPQELRQDWTARDLEWSDEDIFWMIQVTDLHISKYVHLDIKSDLQTFFSTTLDTIQPKLVLASGDLTDAKDSDGVDSFQVEEEWKTYADLLAKNQVQDKIIYLDIRGNHDTFDVHHIHHPNNLHQLYSAKGGQHISSYTYTFHHAGNNYSIFALDTTLKTGPKKVFNFLGVLEDQDYAKIIEEKNSLASNKQIFFGHFPSSCVIAPSPGFRSILEGGQVYLSGHLHTMGGLMPKLYTMHRHGTPELELADFKENRFYRVLAFDNGLLSFTDQKLSDWPVVLITNPKNSHFLAPKVEPVQKIVNSTEIRILAWSPANITSVHVTIDYAQHLCTKHPTIPHLFVLAWQPTQYNNQHSMTVTVQDEAGHQKRVQQTFTTSFDRVENTEYSLYARIILMGDLTCVLQVLWLSSLLISTLPVVLARLCPGVLRHVFTIKTVNSMAALVTFSHFYYLYLTMSLWTGFGPWYMGEILSGHTGIILPWTIFVRGCMLPSFYPYVASFVHLFCFHTPLFWTLLYKFKWRLESEKSKILLAMSNIPVTLVLSSQAVLLLLLYYFPSKLGIFKEICLLIAPFEITMIVLGFVCNGLVSYWINTSRRKH